MEYKEYIITFTENGKVKTEIELGTHAKEAWEVLQKRYNAKEAPELELIDIKKI